MGDWLSIIWSIVGVTLIIVALFVIPIFIEIYRFIKAYRIISERIETLTDVKEWFNVIKFFKKSK